MKGRLIGSSLSTRIKAYGVPAVLLGLLTFAGLIVSESRDDTHAIFRVAHAADSGSVLDDLEVRMITELPENAVDVDSSASTIVALRDLKKGDVLTASNSLALDGRLSIDLRGHRRVFFSTSHPSAVMLVVGESVEIAFISPCVAQHSACSDGNVAIFDSVFVVSVERSDSQIVVGVFVEEAHLQTILRASAGAELVVVG